MISIKEYGELLTKIEEFTNSSEDSHLKVQHIQKLIKTFRKQHTVLVIPSIKEIVANAYALTPDSLNMLIRTDAIKSARQMAMWFYYHYTKWPLKIIGAEFDNGNHKYSHCTVLYAVGKVDTLCSVEKALLKERLTITNDIEVYYQKVERKKEEVFTIQI
jgi:chromosomal replication initiation ATPase DnaA